MQVLLNGREIGDLDARLERRLAGGSDRVVEAVALSPEQSIAARSRQLMVLLGAAAGLAAAMLAVNFAVIIPVVSARAPQALGWMILAGGAALMLIGGLVFALYGLMLGNHRRRVAARGPGDIPPGTVVRIDAAALSVGGQSWPWAGLKVELVDVRDRLQDRRRDTFVDQLTLSDGYRRVRLDALFLSNGRAALGQAWRRLRGLGPTA